MFLGVITLLGVIVVPPYDIATGDMVYQKLCLGRMSIVFLVCSLISLYLNKKGSAFYSSIIWSFIILGGVEAVWGMEQIYGFVTSNHSLFTLTGSFYNPGPYSGYLAMVFPICLNEWLSLRKNQRHTLLEQGKYYLVLGVLLLILCVLPAGMSRSAWIAIIISSIWLYGIHSSWGTHLKAIVKKNKKRLFSIIIFGGIILIMSGYVLFHLKADSANGRLLIWKVNVMAISEKPLLGYGVGNFASAYGMAQENYFAMGKYSAKEELVAGNPEYAFNEYMQVAIECGIPFLIVILLVIAFAFWKGLTERRFGACGGLISVLIFAFSSYPMQIPGFAIAFYFLLAACVVGYSRISILLFSLMINLLGIYYLRYNQYSACKEWCKCKKLYSVGAYQAAKKDYEKLYLELNNQKAFLFEYGHCLHKLKEYEASIDILKEAGKYSNDPMILNIIGKNYQSMGEYEKAEEWLIRSTHRLPGRIYPYYLLAKLYAEPQYYQPEKLKWAIEIVLTKNPKVESNAIQEMREEVKKISF